MEARENWLRAVEFRYPEWIPCSVGFSPLTWNRYRQDLERIVLAHPRIFPRYRPGQADFFDEMPAVYRQGEYYRDNWGCLWYNIQGGLEGQVVEHPLADWRALETYRMPDPLLLEERGPRDWAKIERAIAEQKAQGLLTVGNGERLFDRLYFLRGWDNLMLDFALEPPELARLIGMLEEYELKLIQKWIGLGVDVIGFHTDIGTQKGLMISPASFRKYIKPMFKRLFQTCRQAGIHVSLSSDGCLLEIVDDLVECGVSVHDPQLRANTLDGIARAYKGKLCANVDLDRQSFPFLTPAQIREQIKEVVEVMGAPEGGLMLMAAIYGDDVPLRNIEAICEAMEDYCFPS
jgi:uroporphyrinogen decarboxylase